MSKPTIIDVVKSVLAAAIGVQSKKNRLKDFEQGSLPIYLITGLIFTILFIATLVWIVSAVLA